VFRSSGSRRPWAWTPTEVAPTATVYLIVTVVRALYSVAQSHRQIGRKRLFILTLAIYLVARGIAGPRLQASGFRGSSGSHRLPWASSASTTAYSAID